MPPPMRSLAIVFFLLPAFVKFLSLALVKALNNRCSPWYQRGLIRESLGEIGVVLLHDVEHCFAGEPAMKLGKVSVHLCELLVGDLVAHGPRASAAMPEYTATC
jgi:hypothetical protein